MNAMKQFLSAHPLINALVRMIEGAIVMAIVQYTASGFDWQSVATWKGLGVAIVGACIVALRNWLIQSPVNPQNPPSAPFSAGTKTMAMVLVCIIALAGMVGCSATTVQTVENYVNEFLPLLTTVANLILATEAPGVLAIAQPIEAQVENDLQLVEAQAATITSQNYAQVRQSILNLAADAQQSEGQLLAAAHITNPATLAKVTALIALGNGVIQDIVNALPPANASAEQQKVAGVKVGGAIQNYRHEYNRIVSQKTGDAKVDAVLEKAPRFRRYLLLKD